MLRVARWSFWLGPLLAIGLYLLLPRDGLSDAGRATVAVGLWMAIWWITEAIPIEATSLLPIAAFPLLGIAPVEAAAAPYASDVIYLFMGGLILGLSMERWGLHRRIAMAVVSRAGAAPGALVGGLMLACATISMFVSNTATAVMMLPIASSIVAAIEGSLASDRRARNVAPCMLLGVAYAASIGGVGTLVGTPPNAILAAQAATHPEVGSVSFARWLIVGVPCVAIFLPIAWLLLTRVVLPVPFRAVPGLAGSLREERRALGPPTRPEIIVVVVFSLTALAWVFRVPLARVLGLTRGGAGQPEVVLLSDAGISMIAALALFAAPASRRERVMDWATASRLPWGVLVLFGGGLSLAKAISANGVDAWIGNALHGISSIPPVLLLLAITALIVFLTEVASNTAIATAFIPIAYSVASRAGIPPLLLMVPVAIAASFAFMLPMGTPPNALVFATGRLTIRQMARAGLVLNLAAIVVIAAIAWFLVPLL